MSSIAVAVKIWTKTIVLNAFFMGMLGLLNGKMITVFVSMISLVGGFIVTLPLLMLIVPLVTLSTSLPYGTLAKSVWLCFYLILLVLVFYGVLVMGTFLEGKFWVWQSLGSTIAGLLIAVLTTRKSLKKLYTRQ